MFYWIHSFHKVDFLMKKFMYEGVEMFKIV